MDVSGGQAVQLVQGRAGSEKRFGDPRAAGTALAGDAGAEWVHLVDLDAAFGRGHNAEIIAEVTSHLRLDIELIRRIRDDATLEQALATGCAPVNIGTAALENPEWCEEIIAAHGDRIAIGLDVRGTKLAARGWTREGGDLCQTLRRLDQAGCARFVVTDVNSDGMLAGQDLNLLTRVCEATKKPVVASGGISTLEDILALAEMVSLGVGAIIGTAPLRGQLHHRGSPGGHDLPDWHHEANRDEHRARRQFPPGRICLETGPVRAQRLDGRLRDLLAGKKIVMTGVTGFIGEQLLWKILTELPDTTPSVLVRRKRSAGARDRVISLVKKPIFASVREAYGGAAELVDARIEVIEGDLPGVSGVPADLDVVVHCAGDVSFDPPIDQAFTTNVIGTKALLDRVLQAVTDADGARTKVPHYVHISTAYTAGRRRGRSRKLRICASAADSGPSGWRCGA